MLVLDETRSHHLILLLEEVDEFPNVRIRSLQLFVDDVVVLFDLVVISRIKQNAQLERAIEEINYFRI